MKKNFSPDFYEHQAWNKNLLIAGIDEVGRGCLAGPVVTAMVTLPVNTKEPFADSKKLSEKAREKAYHWLMEHAACALGVADHTTIHSHNIYHATLRAMRAAALNFAAQHPNHLHNLDAILVDAMPLTLPPLFTAPIHSFTFGETYSRTIAAASIVAKVTRDRLMKTMHTYFPAYSFARDKAYASARHCTQLRTSSATFVHRSQFIATVRQKKKDSSL